MKLIERFRAYKKNRPKNAINNKHNKHHRPKNVNTYTKYFGITAKKKGKFFTQQFLSVVRFSDGFVDFSLFIGLLLFDILCNPFTLFRIHTPLCLCFFLFLPSSPFSMRHSVKQTRNARTYTIRLIQIHFQNYIAVCRGYSMELDITQNSFRLMNVMIPKQLWKSPCYIKSVQKITDKVYDRLCHSSLFTFILFSVFEFCIYENIKVDAHWYALNCKTNTHSSLACAYRMCTGPFVFAPIFIFGFKYVFVWSPLFFPLALRSRSFLFFFRHFCHAFCTWLISVLWSTYIIWRMLNYKLIPNFMDF